MENKKCKCGNDSFHMQVIDDCSTCENNGGYDPESEEWTNDNNVIESEMLERTQVRENNECAFGYCFDNGCYIFKCTACGKEDNLPMSEG